MHIVYMNSCGKVKKTLRSPLRLPRAGRCLPVTSGLYSVRAAACSLQPESAGWEAVRRPPQAHVDRSPNICPLDTLHLHHYTRELDVRNQISAINRTNAPTRLDSSLVGAVVAARPRGTRRRTPAAGRRFLERKVARSYGGSSAEYSSDWQVSPPSRSVAHGTSAHLRPLHARAGGVRPASSSPRTRHRRSSSSRERSPSAGRRSIPPRQRRRHSRSICPSRSRTSLHPLGALSPPAVAHL